MDRVIAVCMNPATDRVLEVADFKAGGRHTGNTVLVSPAGKGVNIARALTTLGVRSIVIGFVGEDCFDEYEQSLNSNLCQAQFLRVPGKTRENITIVDPAGSGDTHIRLEGLRVSAPQLQRFERKLNLLAGKDRVVVFGGSLPSGVDVPAFRRMVESCLRNGARVVLEVGAPLLRAVRDLPLWLVKPSVEELAGMVDETVEGEADIVKHGLKLSRHIQTVLVSCGQAGAYAFVGSSGMIGQVEIDSDQIRSTVGSGDCMLAGFLAARLNGSPVKEAFRQGLAAGAASSLSMTPGRIDLVGISESLFRAVVEPLDRGNRERTS